VSLLAPQHEVALDWVLLAYGIDFNQYSYTGSSTVHNVDVSIY